MEAFKDFIKELKDRISNPLTSSFIIAWLFCNYKIPLGIIFYKQADLSRDGYKSYFDLVDKNIHYGYMIALPLAIAGLYTWGAPHVKGWITNYQAGVTTSSDSRLHKKTGKNTILIEDHQAIVAERDKQKQAYAELINEQSTVKVERDRLLSEKADLIVKHDSEIELLKKETDERVEKLSELEKDRIANLDSQYNLRVDQLNSTIATMRVAEEMLSNQISTDAANHAAEILNLKTEHEYAINQSNLSRNETAEHFREKIEELRLLQKAHDELLVYRDSLGTKIDQMTLEHSNETMNHTEHLKELSEQLAEANFQLAEESKRHASVEVNRDVLIEQLNTQIQELEAEKSIVTIQSTTNKINLSNRIKTLEHVISDSAENAKVIQQFVKSLPEIEQTVWDAAKKLSKDLNNAL